MPVSIPASTLEKFTTFGDLLRFLRRRVSLTQMELAVAVGYSDSQISRLEQNLRLPDIPTIQSLFIPALGLEDEPKAIARLFDLAANVRREDAPALGLCPYKGLNYFDDADADLFVGREALTAKLTEHIIALTSTDSPSPMRFLAVVGASGSGKSSLVRAGLVSSLRWNNQSADWHIHVLTPTAHPLERLAMSLAGDHNAEINNLINDLLVDENALQNFIKRKFQPRKNAVLLVIDQFEEVFTLCRSEEEKASFIGNLLAAASESVSPITVLVTLRADFYAYCANYIQLREALARNQEYIGAMNTDELRRAIEEPAQRGRWEIESGLVDLLLHDVGQEPGALPLLSHALLETWQRRRGRTMTLSGYASSGGVRGAIAETAETVFTDQFTREQQAIARRIFLRLTELSDEISLADTRRRATFNELILNPLEAAATHAVLKSLADARLITTSQDSAEVAHEALIREWPTLRNWLEDNREGLRLHRQLTDATLEWQISDRETDLLYRGVRLAQVREWAQSHGEDLNPSEMEFLNASVAQSEQESREREAQRQRELDSARKLAETERYRAEELTRSARNLRARNRVITVVGVIAIFLAILAGLFGQQSNQNAVRAAQNAQIAQNAEAIALKNAEEADQAKAEAEAQQRIAIARELAASADNNLDIDPQRSILLALQGVNITTPDRFTLPEVENALHRAIAASRIQKTITAHDGTIWALAYSPDGTRFATGGTDKEVRVWDSKTYENLLTIDAHEADIDSIAFSPDGKWFATSSDDGVAKVWDVETGQKVFQLNGHSGPIMAVTFHPDGSRLATLSADNTIKFWDAENGALLHSWDDLQVSNYAMAYSPDGLRILYIDAGKLRVMDSESGDEFFSIPVNEDLAGNTFALSPDGRKIAMNDNGMIHVYDADKGQSLFNLLGPTNAVQNLAFSPDSSMLAITGLDRKVEIHDAETGFQIFVLAGHNQGISRVAFSPDGGKITSADFGGIVKTWSLEPSKEVLTIPNITPMRFGLSPDGTKVATTSDFLQVWDAQSGNLVFEREAHNGAIGVAFSADGKWIATGGRDQTIKVWDPNNGNILHTFPVEDRRIWGVAFHPNRPILAAAGTGGIVQLFDLTDDKPLRSWDAGLGALFGVAFNPNGSQIAVVSSESNDVKVFDTESGEEIFTLIGHTGANPGNISLAFSPDDLRLITGGRDATARIWDTTNGKLLVTLMGHTSTVRTVVFSGDGTRVATGGNDGTVRIWDASTGGELLEVQGYMAMFTPDGRRLIIMDDEGMKVLALQIDELVQIALSRLTRIFTLEECQKYLHTDTCPSEP